MTQDPPYSQEAEESCIGAVLTNPLYYFNIAAFLKPDDFFFVRHSYIWQAIGNLEERHEPVDTVTLSIELQAMGHLVEIGGPAYLTQLIRNTPTSTHAEIYGALVKRTAQRRQLLLALDTARLLVYDEEMSINKVFERVEAHVLSVTVSEKKQEETDINSIVNDYMDDVERLVELRNQGIIPGIPTGYKGVDEIIGGSYKKELTVIAGPAKSGKSTYNLNITRNRAKLGATIVIFTCEMSRAAIVRKFISMETQMSAKIIKNADFTPEQWSLFVEASNRMSKWKIHIIDEYKGLTPLDVRRKLRRIQHNEQVDCVLIDGLWLMRSNRPAEARHTAVADIMKDLAEIAAKMNVPIDLVHQMNRAASTRHDPRPVLSDFSESIGVEQTGSILIFLYRESYYKQDASDEMEIIIAANREGDSGTAKLGFDKQSETYHNLKTITTRHIPLQNTGDDRKDIYQ